MARAPTLSSCVSPWLEEAAIQAMSANEYIVGSSPSRNVQQFLRSRELGGSPSPARREAEVRSGLVERLPLSLRERELPVERYRFDKVRLFCVLLEHSSVLTLGDKRALDVKVFASAWLDADTVVFGTKDNKVLSRLLGRRGSTFRFVLQLFVCGPRSPRVTHIPLHETTHAPLADQCGIHRLFAFLTHWPGCISLLDHLVALSLQHQFQRQPQSPGNWRTFLKHP